MKGLNKIWTIAALVLTVGLGVTVLTGCSEETAQISEMLSSVTDGKVQVDMDELAGWGEAVTDKVAEGFGDLESNVNYELEGSSMFDDNYEILAGDIAKYCPGEGISNLAIAVGGCNFQTKNSSDEKIYVEVENAYQFQGFIEDGTLHIRGTVGSTTLEELDNFKIILYLPESYEFTAIDCEVGAGLVKMESVASKNAHFKVGAGAINLKGIKAAQLSLEVGAGQLEVTKMEIESLNVKVGMGNCTAKGTVNAGVNVVCSMGNVGLHLTGNEKDFNYSLKGAMGNIRLEDKKYSGLTSEQTIANNAGKDMNVECSMGNVTIEFED